MLRFLMCLVLACSGMHAVAQVYKWVDANGGIQYGDAPPKGVKATPVSGGVTVMPAFRPPPAPEPADAGVRSAVPDARQTGAASAASSSLSEREARKRALLAACVRDRGANCEADVEAQLDGRDTTVYVPVPGWSRPPIVPSRPPHHGNRPGSAQQSSSSSRVAETRREAPRGNAPQRPARREDGL